MTDKQLIIVNKWKKEAGERFANHYITDDGTLVISIFDKVLTLYEPAPIVHRYGYDQDGDLIFTRFIAHGIN